MKDSMGMRGWVRLVDLTTGKIIGEIPNTLTDTFRSEAASWWMADPVTPPLYIALGTTAALATETPSGFTALKSEMHRAGGIGTISRSKAADETARFVQVFTANQGVGTVQELGLFNANEATSWVSQCEAISENGSDWTSDGVIAADAVIYAEGATSLSSAMAIANSVAFQHIDLGKNPLALTGAGSNDGGAYTDQTAAANSAAANDMTLLPAAPAVNDAYYFGGAGQFSILTLNVGTIGSGYSIAWEYWNGYAWTALTVTDNTSGFTVGGSNTVTFTIPGDWMTTNLVDGNHYYWIRARATAVPGPITQPLGTQAWISLVVNADAYLQFAYYIDNIANFTNFTSIRVGNTAGNYWEWTASPPALPTLVTGWNWINLKLTDLTQTGAPTLAVGNSIGYFRIATSRTVATVEKLDKVRIFEPRGDLLARAEITFVKSLGNILGVYWYITSREVTVAEYTSFAKETLTIAGASVGLTSGIYAPSGAQAARRATIRVETAPIRFWTTGDAPDPAAVPPEGLLLETGEETAIDGATDIANFRAIRDTGISAIIQVQYER